MPKAKTRKRKFRTWDNYSDSSSGEDLSPVRSRPRKRRRVSTTKSARSRRTSNSTAKPVRLTGSMSFKDAADVILKEVQKPLNARELTRVMVDRNMVSSSGKTPHLSVAAQLYVDMKTLGSGSRFVKAGPGTFGLRCWPGYEKFPPHEVGGVQQGYNRKPHRTKKKKPKKTVGVGAEGEPIVILENEVDRDTPVKNDSEPSPPRRRRSTRKAATRARAVISSACDASLPTPATPGMTDRNPVVVHAATGIPTSSSPQVVASASAASASVSAPTDASSG